jgi:hypothetical protein
MMKSLKFGRFAVVCCAVWAMLGCGMPQGATPAGAFNASSHSGSIMPASPKRPTVVGITSSHRKHQNLIDWPLRPGGGLTPETLSGDLGKDLGIFSMAADGDVVVMAASGAGALVTYNVDTHAEKMLHDPNGQPTDVAVDRQGNFYATEGYGGVTVFEHGSSHTSKLTCPGIYTSFTIAVDDEGDVFITGETYQPAIQKLLEFPAGATTCKILNLKTKDVGALGVDPKTDDLIILENQKQGSKEALMLIYPKPYRDRTVQQHILHATTGAFELRLDATSTHILYEDFFHGINKPLVDQAEYPSGKFDGHYEDGRHKYVDWVTGFTTIPNALPN